MIRSPLLFAFALWSLSAVAALSSENVLQFGENAIRALTKNANFTLGRDFRDKFGNLRSDVSVVERENNLQSTVKLEQCQDMTAYTDCQLYNIAAPCNKDSFADGAISYYASASSFCVSFNLGVDAVNVNYDKSTEEPVDKNIELGTPAITCPECYAYIGGAIQLELLCSIAGATLGCYTAFSTGGAIDLKIDLQLENPEFTLSTESVILAGPSDPNTADYSSGSLVYDANGLIVRVIPALTAQAKGSGKMSGSAKFTASFSTSANYMFSLDTSGNFVNMFDANVDVSPPTLTRTSFYVTDDVDVQFNLLPDLYWKISFGIDNVMTTDAYLQTPFKLSYGFQESAPQSTSTAKSLQDSCSLSESIGGSAAVTSIGATVLNVPSAAPVSPSMSPYEGSTSTEATCIGGTAPSPTPPGPEPAPSPTPPGPAPSPTSGTSSGSDNNKLGPVAIAGIVIGTTFALFFAAGGFFYYVKRFKRPLSSLEDAKYLDTPINS